VIYCINPACECRQNVDEAVNCASCSSHLLINNRLTLIRKISFDEEVESFEVIDNQSSFSGTAGSHKVLKILKDLDPNRREAFENEADILMSLNHKLIPKVDAIYDYFHLDIDTSHRRIYCLVMSKFEGMNLEQYIEREGAISQNKAINFLQQLSDILIYIHTKEFDNFLGIIHRDIKPSNIIVQPSGELALIDFGFALKMSESYREQLRNGEISIVSSMFYTAPEQQARKPVIQSDYYSLGMTIIFAVTGKQLYEIEVSRESWKLKWQGLTKIDKPLIRCLEMLTDSNPIKRPLSSWELDKLLNQTLVKDLSLYNRLRSKPFRFSALACSVLVIIGLLYCLRLGLSSHLLKVGNKALDDQHFSDARRNFETAIKILPNADAYNNLGIACSKLGDLNCEEQSYKKAVELSPMDWTGYYQLGTYYEDKVKPDYKEAERLYRKAVDLSPSRAFLARNNLARVLMSQGHYEQAESYLKEELSQKKDKKSEAVLKKNLGWLYLQTNRYKLAKQLLNESIELDPTFNGPHCLLAKLYGFRAQQSSYEIKLCIGLHGEDLMYPEVYRWRNETINELLDRRSSIAIDSLPS
jgi:serine/threonine protein kinase